MEQKIDFVIPWVNGNDPKWQKERAKYKSETGEDSGVYRYRELVDLKYMFRGIDQFAPWVDKIHLITYGHLPDFLNIDHPKINIVRHEDFIPQEYLPTFSSHPIELNLHRIDNLADQFVYFNDDTFLVGPMEAKDFFDKGIPSDQATLDYITSDKGRIFPHVLLNNLDMLNRNFSKKEVIKKHRSLWFNKKYGVKGNLKNLYFYPLAQFSGIKWHHAPIAYLKSTLEDVWKVEAELLNQSSLNKFRSITDVNQYVFRNWQLVKGKFNPVSMDKIARFYNMPSLEEAFVHDLKNNTFKLICVNDSEDIEDFEALKKRVNQAFENHLPEKSSFEL